MKLKSKTSVKCVDLGSDGDSYAQIMRKQHSGWDFQCINGSFRIVVIGGDFDTSIKFPSVLLILPAITLSSCDPTSSLTPHLTHAHTNTQTMVRLKYFACTENKIKKCRYKCKVERVSANHTHTQICTKQYTCRHARCSDSLICLHLTVRPLKLSHLERWWENYGSDVVGRWHSVGSQKYVVHWSVGHACMCCCSSIDPFIKF